MKQHKHAEVIKAWADGAQIECVDRGVWVECPGPTWQEYAEYRVKPAAPAYPVTQMNDDVICSTFYDGGQVIGSNQELAAFYRIANAALRHAIDAGQIVTKDEHESALIQLGEHLRGIAIAHDAARDMAIAEAVRDACYVAAMNCSAGFEGTVVRQIRLQALAAIIATIK